MEKYYCHRRSAELVVSPATELSNIDAESRSLESDYDQYRCRHITHDNERWATELHRYLKDIPADVTKDTDIIEWWQVCSFLHLLFIC